MQVVEEGRGAGRTDTRSVALSFQGAVQVTSLGGVGVIGIRDEAVGGGGDDLGGVRAGGSGLIRAGDSAETPEFSGDHVGVDHEEHVREGGPKVGPVNRPVSRGLGRVNILASRAV